MGNSTNEYRTAMPYVEVNEDTGVATIYLYVGENGYGVYELKVESPPTTGIPKIPFNSISLYSSGEKLNILHPWRIIDQVKIVDLNGRIIWQASKFASESVNISSLAQGMYLLKLVKNNHSSVHKFIKNKAV